MASCVCCPRCGSGIRGHGRAARSSHRCAWGHGRQASGTGPVLFALFHEERLPRDPGRGRVPGTAGHTLGVRAARRAPPCHQGRRSGIPCRIPSCGIRHGHVRRELQLAGTGGVPDQRDADPGPAEPACLFRRRGRQLSLYQVAREISDRLIGTFLADADGRRPVPGGQPILQSDPHWRDLLLFYETSMATTEPASARVSRPAGPVPRGSCRCSSAGSAPRDCVIVAVAPSRARRGTGVTR